MKGSCLCGAVRFSADGTPSGVNCCHCTQCRKANGTAFATNAAFDRAGFRIEAGLETLSSYESTPGSFRYFCSRCGSPIYCSAPASPDVVYVRVGALDDAAGLGPDVHLHVASKAPWYEILDEIPQRQAEEDLWF